MFQLSERGRIVQVWKVFIQNWSFCQINARVEIHKSTQHKQRFELSLGVVCSKAGYLHS